MTLESEPAPSEESNSRATSENPRAANPVASQVVIVPPFGADLVRTHFSSERLAQSHEGEVGPFVSGVRPGSSLRGVAREAGRLTRGGLKLAAKGAVFTARARFIDALELIADARRGESDRFSQPRSGGRTGRPTGGGRFQSAQLDDGGDMRPVCAGCRTLHASIESLPPPRSHRLQALQVYYSYATGQLAAAVGGVPEGSMALYYLARLQPFLGDGVYRAAVLAEPKAIALQQAAILVDPKNYRAANELGVLLADCGQLEASRKAFLYMPRFLDVPKSCRIWPPFISGSGTSRKRHRWRRWRARNNADEKASPTRVPRRHSSIWSIKRRLPETRPH